MNNKVRRNRDFFLFVPTSFLSYFNCSVLLLIYAFFSPLSSFSVFLFFCVMCPPYASILSFTPPIHISPLSLVFSFFLFFHLFIRYLHIFFFLFNSPLPPNLLFIITHMAESPCILCGPAFGGLMFLTVQVGGG